MRDSFLRQAFKLLDQHDQLQVVPVVCRLWYQLVPSTCSSLEVKVYKNCNRTPHPVHLCIASWTLR
jgi:hypothetical protein